MPQNATIPTTTTINVVGGSSIDIYTYYNDGTFGPLLSALITDTPFPINMTPFTEGELALTYTTGANPTVLDFIINPNGELTAISYDAAFPASNYSTDPLSGQLQVTV